MIPQQLADMATNTSATELRDFINFLLAKGQNYLPAFIEYKKYHAVFTLWCVIGPLLFVLSLFFLFIAFVGSSQEKKWKGKLLCGIVVFICGLIFCSIIASIGLIWQLVLNHYYQGLLQIASHLPS
jgi:hypothetical protein